jgi:hypothetical protein
MIEKFRMNFGSKTMVYSTTSGSAVAAGSVLTVPEIL